MLYGEPRLTHDVDLVIEIEKSEHVRALAEHFPAQWFYLPPEQVIRIEASRERRGHFNVIHLESGYKADLYLAGEDPFHRWALDHVNLIEFSAQKLPVAPPEYVIVRKLEYYREGGSQKHLKDIRAILRNTSVPLNRVELDRWLEIGGVAGVWQEHLERK